MDEKDLESQVISSINFGSYRRGDGRRARHVVQAGAHAARAFGRELGNQALDLGADLATAAAVIEDSVSSNAQALSGAAAAYGFYTYKQYLDAMYQKIREGVTRLVPTVETYHRYLRFRLRDRNHRPRPSGGFLTPAKRVRRSRGSEIRDSYHPGVISTQTAHMRRRRFKRRSRRKFRRGHRRYRASRWLRYKALKKRKRYRKGKMSKTMFAYNVARKSGLGQTYFYSQGTTIPLTNTTGTLCCLSYDTRKVVENTPFNSHYYLGQGNAAWTSAQCLDFTLEGQGLLGRIKENNMFDLAKKSILSKRTYEFTLTNMTKHAIKGKMYWVTPRHDIGYIDNGAYPYNPVGGIHGSDWNEILAICLGRDSLFQGAGAAKYQVTEGCLKRFGYGRSLMESATFCSYFKVLKVNTFEMAAGACQTQVIQKKKPWSIGPYYYDNLNNIGSAWGFPNKTIIPILHAIGCNVTDGTIPEGGEVGDAFPGKEELGSGFLSIHFSVRTQLWRVESLAGSNYYDVLTGPAGVVAVPISIQRPVAADVAE